MSKSININPDIAKAISDKLESRKVKVEPLLIPITEGSPEAQWRDEYDSFVISILSAAVEWQSFWHENPTDQAGIDRRQGYLYDRVRHFLIWKGEQE